MALLPLQSENMPETLLPAFPAAIPLQEKEMVGSQREEALMIGFQALGRLWADGQPPGPISLGEEDSGFCLKWRPGTGAGSPAVPSSVHTRAPTSSCTDLEAHARLIQSDLTIDLPLCAGRCPGPRREMAVPAAHPES